MGVSAIGQRMSAATIRHVLVTVLVMLGLFYYLYGPPLTQAFERAALAKCVDLTGKNYRTYSLEWKTTWFGSLEPPHWLCTDRRENALKDYDLGWWVDL